MFQQVSRSSVSFRAVFIGLFCATIECLLAPYNDYVIRNIFLAGGHFPVGPFFILIIFVLGINVILKHINPKSAFSPGELITIWCIMLAPAGIPSSGMMRYAISPMVAYQYFATPENDWESLFFHYIPHWRVVRDETAITSFYRGLFAGESVPWSAWITPIFIWSTYVIVVYFVMICLSVLLRKQWVEYERCAFPLVKLPVEMATQGMGRLGPLFKNSALWFGFAFPVFLHTINGLHTFFPSVPHIPRDFWLNQFLTDRPWSALRPFQIVIFWSMVGFSYLLTLEVSFSIWFFFIFYKLQCFIGVLLGFQLTSGPGVQWTGKSFSAAQETGACLVFVAIALWKTRHHIKNMIKTGSSDEALPYGVTIIGLIGGISVLVFFNHLMGMSILFAIGFVLFLLAMYIVLTWQVINGGIPFINPSFSPQSFFLTTLGTSKIHPSTLTSLMMHPVCLTLDLREFMMPNIMNGLKAADEARIKRRQLLIAMAVAMVIGLGVSYYSALKVGYAHGAPYMGGSWFMRQLEGLLVSPKTTTNWTNTGFIVFGGGFTGWLMWMRQTFVWWPLHPLGYTMLSSWATFKLWFSIFLGWGMKFAIVKYGGLKAYRQARPVFLGLVIGEMTCAGLWAIVGMVTGISSGYRILPD